MHLQYRTFENIVAKEQIVQNEQFLPLPRCFQFSIIEISLIQVYHILGQGFRSLLLQICFMWEMVKLSTGGRNQ